MSSTPTDPRSSASAGAGSDQPATLGRAAQAGRLLLAIGGGLLIVSSLQPWATGVNAAGQPVAYRPTGGLGEGVYMLVGGIVAVALAAYRPFVETTNRVLQLAPLAVAVAIGLISLNAVRYVASSIAGWVVSGGSGEQTLGPTLAITGLVLTAAASLWLEWARPAEVRRRTRPLLVELGVTRRGVAGMIIAGALGLGGGVLGMGVTVMAFGIQGVLPGILLGIFGFLIGVALGSRLARRIIAAG